MTIALRKPRMTREQFFDWTQAQNTRHEFDGFAPVAMTAGTITTIRSRKTSTLPYAAG